MQALLVPTTNKYQEPPEATIGGTNKRLGADTPGQKWLGGRAGLWAALFRPCESVCAVGNDARPTTYRGTLRLGVNSGADYPLGLGHCTRLRAGAGVTAQVTFGMTRCQTRWCSALQWAPNAVWAFQKTGGTYPWKRCLPSMYALDINSLCSL